MIVATSRIWGDSGQDERMAWRDAALAAIDAGRRAGALPADLYAEKAIYTWMSYIRNSAEDAARRRHEMTGVLNIFLEWLPMDIDSARRASGAWRDQPIDVIKSLRNIRSFLKLMEPGAGYLAPDDREILDRWLDCRESLP